MNEVVKYSNELHEMNFSSLTETQQNIFFTLLQQFKGTDGYTLELDFNTLYELADIPRNTDFRQEILNKLSKLQDFKFRYQINDLGDLQQDIIFPSMKTDTANKKLFVKVSKGFKERYINSPLKGWTRYELAEFVWLNGTYTKTIYRYLKQFRTQGRWRVTYKDFKYILGIPESYRARDIDKRILTPTIKALSEPRNIFEATRIPFESLSVIKHKKGREIEALEFTFMPQTPTMLEKDKVEYERNLTTIANDIKRKDMLKELKRPPRINPITGQKIDELSLYIGRHFSIKNNKFGGYDTCKIQNLSIDYNGKIQGKAINQETNKNFKLEFESIEHLKNALNLN